MKCLVFKLFGRFQNRGVLFAEHLGEPETDLTYFSSFVSGLPSENTRLSFYFILFVVAGQPQMGQGILIVEALRSHSAYHTLWESSHRPLPDNTQHSQKIDIHVLGGIRPTIPASEWPQTHALDRTASGIGTVVL
jgi:hypothetical protein